MNHRFLAAGLLLGAFASSCKVPLSDINAREVVSDVVWFAEEETMFVFWEIQADQGLTDDSAVEVRFVTDDGEQDWVEALALPQIHPTVPADCDFNALCGVASFRVPKAPRDVEMRLRYSRAGELAKVARRTKLSVVGPGAAHSNRSVLIYGVFDEANRAVQWRARHTFPNLRNQQVERLGLRRPFTVRDPRYASVDRTSADNPYAYATRCSESFEALGWAPVGTDERAIFAPETLPDEALSASVVCGVATVQDAKGPFEAAAFARKNPEVRPAFPELRSPIVDARQIDFLLQLCDRDISSSHLAMQRQRLLMGDDVAATCIDGLRGDALTAYLSVLFQEAVDEVRAEGRDMVLAIAVHHDTPGIGPAIEAAIAAVVVPERTRSTPRLAGAFVLDSYAYQMTDAEAGRSAIWCPSAVVLDESAPDVVSLASLDCVVLPDVALSLGPISASALPIFTTRESYLKFVDTYSEAQAGRMVSLAFRVPELPPTVDSVDVDPFGVATFFNDEAVAAARADAFSYCQNRREYAGFVFRTPATMTPLPISLLPAWHNTLREPSYELGLAWAFPYQLQLTYEIVIATAVSVFSASLALGFGVDASQDFGDDLWSDDDYSLRRTLVQCTRHCDHPTFDAAGIYQVNAVFRAAYAQACYAPAPPERPGMGFPLDP